jgi:hypothetical protein
MKTIRNRVLQLAGICAGGLVIATALTVQSQNAPVLTIKNLGTNVFSISITNGIGTSIYDLQWTPALVGPGSSWSWVSIGTPGQTNFISNMPDYPMMYFRTILDTNSLWKAADPNNPTNGVLSVFIDSPANGFNITQ